MTRTHIWFAAFAGVVIAANFLTDTLGLVTLLGLTATAGTWVAGFGFVVRDELHEVAGRHTVAAAILTGAALSAVLSPQLAVASATAFLVSESADWAIYAPMRQRNRMAAALLSNTVGALIDTALFLLIAGFPLDGAPTQVVVKVGTTALVLLGVRLVVSRQSLHTRGGGRDA